MKLIIDIPEDYYKAIKEIPVEQSTADMMIIQNGTPLEQEPCENSIVEWEKDFKGYVNSLSMPRDDYNGIMEYIDELPVKPAPKMGWWIPQGGVDENGNRNYCCSNCGHGDLQAVSQIVPYCWWCGAKMQEVKE